MRQLIFSVAVIFLIIANSVFPQVGINSDGSSPDNSSMLDVKSTNKSFLLPRMTQAERNSISSPATGLMILQTDQNAGFYYYDGTAWTAQAGSEETGHYVGELYGGGVVFWVDQTGQHGLICSMIDLSTSQAWSNVTTTLIGVTAQSDWDGLSNSNAITGQTGHTGSAAKLCFDYTNDDYETGIYSDWYLPSSGELNHAWNNLYEVQKALNSDENSATTAFGLGYWSSSEYSSDYAWYQLFVNGLQFHANKNNTGWVRAVRAF
jgi:hypothetical protein